IGNLAAMEPADARSRVNGEAEDLFRRLGRHFLDIHAAFGRGDEGDARGRAVNEDGEVELALDGGTFLDIEAVHFLAFGARLMGHERRTEQAPCLLLDILDRLHHLHAAGLAATARMDLRLDDPYRPAQLFRFRDSLFRSERCMPPGHRHTVLRKHGFGLVFVNIHEKPSGWKASRKTAAPKENIRRPRGPESPESHVGWFGVISPG